MDIREANRKAWDKQVEWGNEWTVPVSAEVIKAARQGQWEIYLTPTKPVPKNWFPDLKGLEVLCLASGGGQQGPILAAAGANVTVFDNSPQQLRQDQLVAERDGLAIKTVEGDMADLSAFPEGRFAVIVHPVSNCFIPDVHPVWREAFRVLRRKGVLLSGFNNPVVYIFDEKPYLDGVLIVKHTLPYSDIVSLSEEEKQQHIDNGEPFEFSHMLEDLIGGQLKAGFLLDGFYEDYDKKETNDALSKYMTRYIATRAIKLS